MIEEVSGCSITFEARILSQANLFGICGGTETGFFFCRGTATFPCPYRSTVAPYSFIHL